jgi:hypothetical protein
MKLEGAGEHDELFYCCAVLSPEWGGGNPGPCLIPEKDLSSLPLLALPNAVLIPSNPLANEEPPTAGQLVKTTAGLVLTVTDMGGIGYTSFLVETGEVLSSRPQSDFVHFQGWKIALPSPLRCGRWDVILEWPRGGDDNGAAV